MGEARTDDSGNVSLDILSIEGIWPSSMNTEQCCIYRVPDRLRRENPEAYTPQLLLIGPLHHSKKAEAIQLLRQSPVPQDLEKTKSRYLGYVNMELLKKTYLEKFAKRVGGETIEQLKKTIKDDEQKIRASYAESTAWISSPAFVDMILHDSVFITEFLLRAYEKGDSSRKTGDMLMDEPCLQNTVYDDLILLENQLPYFLLEKLFDPIINTLLPNQRLRDFIIVYFQFQHLIKETAKFLHFTDLFRCVRVETLCLNPEQMYPKPSIPYMYNAKRLQGAGVKFVGDERVFSLEVKFDRGRLKIPYILLYDNLELNLRNIMALEQCHYPYNPYVCNYVIFLDFLIDTDEDVDLLAESGILRQWTGRKATLKKMVNSLCIGVVEVNSLYYDVAESLNGYYDNYYDFWNLFVTLRRFYFTDLWVGTGTVAAIVLLVLTFLQTFAAFRWK